MFKSKFNIGDKVIITKGRYIGNICKIVDMFSERGRTRYRVWAIGVLDETYWSYELKSIDIK